MSPGSADPDQLAREIARLRETVSELLRRDREHRRAERSVALHDAVTRALAEAPSLEKAAPGILRVLCEALDWQMAALWSVEPHGGLLRCVELWHRSPGSIPEFEAATRRHTFARGIGMPGRVWATAQPAWIPDIAMDENFPRADIAAREGLRACLAFPIAIGGEVVGVVEFFSPEIRQPDEKLLEMLAALGSQIGQFVDRKYAEEVLDRFFTLSIDMLCIAGWDGYFKRLNPAWESILGYRIEELTSTPFLEFVHPDDRAATLAEMEKLAQGEITISFENRYRAKDGSYKWMLWNATPFAQQQLIYAAARDITERRQAVEKIHRLREEAEAANRAKSEFLARMSHEIRTPLNVVLGMGELLERTELNGEQQKYVRVFQKAGGNLRDLVNDILDLSKVEAGRITLEEVDFELAGMLQSTVEMMSVRAREKGIALDYQVQLDVPARVRGDVNRLRQVLLNLVGNALKFTAQGKVGIRVERDPEGSGALRFAVSDTGIGVPADKLGSIFESFTQADASISRTYGGTGLGLAISQRLVGLMDGSIWAESAPGAGSTFYFTARLGAPLAPASPAETPEAPAQAPAGNSKGLHILVADDSEENQFLVAAFLKDAGCRVDFADNGQIAAEKFCADAYDLVLMDLQMPVLDGYAATRRIRGWEQAQKRTATPILALTASALEAERQEALDSGCNVCLQKPIRLATLLEAVAQHAGRPGGGMAAPPETIAVRADARLRAVIPEYLDKRRQDVATILAALDRSDYETIRELGHKMSGTGGGYGFPRITAMGTALEGGARNRNPAEIRARADELSHYLERVEVID